MAQVAAALFTAPIFVLLIGRFAFGQRFGIWRLIAVVLGFAGVWLMLRPEAGAFRPVGLVPVAAAVLYALGNIATRECCAGGKCRSTLTAGFFVGFWAGGSPGSAVLAVFPQAGAARARADFMLRGWGTPDRRWPGDRS